VDGQMDNGNPGPSIAAENARLTDKHPSPDPAV
jgi:hypothetical protein